MKSKNSFFIILIRWIGRVTSSLFIGIFLLFFFGEGNFNEFIQLSLNEWFLILFIPVLFVVGSLVAWKRELVGGLVILASVIGFNVVEFIISGQILKEIEFSFLVIPGLFFMLAATLNCLLQKNVE